MPVYNFNDVLVWGWVGGYVRPARGVRSKRVIDPLTGLTPALTQDGNTVTYLTTDVGGAVRFTATVAVVQADFGFGLRTIYSDERLTATADAAPALAAAAAAQAAVDEITTGTPGTLAVDASRIPSLYPTKANNLADLASAATARANLGLGGSALLAVGTTASTVAAGDDIRFSTLGGGTGGGVSVLDNLNGTLTWTIAAGSAVSVTDNLNGTLTWNGLL